MGNPDYYINSSPKPHGRTFCHKSVHRHVFTYNLERKRHKGKLMVDTNPRTPVRRDLITFKHKSLVDRFRQSLLFWFSVLNHHCED